MCSANMYSEILEQKITEWLAWDKNETTSNALKELIAVKNYKELQRIMLKRITFGTAGLRGKMSVGYACMNDLIIIQTAQGFLKYLEKSDLMLLRNNGIVIGYDGRYNSKRWAELTAAIFVHAGYPVRLFSRVVPTPFIPFSVAKYKCASGIMVTASHNPKEDNGYKVYGANSAQIVSPVDKHVQNSILENMQPLDSSWDTSVLSQSILLKDPLADVLQHYLENINDALLPEHRTINNMTSILFTYTAMHGVGYPYVKEVFDSIDIKFVSVPEQEQPDPEFPTVKFPNPEEGKSSLDLSFRTANAHGSSIILANDPDADRLAVAEKDSKTGEWKVFTGTLSLVLQLSIIDVFSPYVAIPEILVLNNKTWIFPSEMCPLFSGTEIFVNSLTLWLIICFNFHVVSLWNLHKNSTDMKNKNPLTACEDESNECLVTKKENANRTLNIDYRRRQNDVSVVIPSILIWFFCLSLSIPNFSLTSTLNTKHNQIICAILDNFYGHILQTLLLVFRVLLPIPLLVFSFIILNLKLSKSSSKDIVNILTKEFVEIRKLLIFCISLTVLYLSTSLQRNMVFFLHINSHSFYNNTTDIFRLPPLYNNQLDDPSNVSLSMLHYSCSVLRIIMCICLVPNLRVLIKSKIFKCFATKKYLRYV